MVYRGKPSAGCEACRKAKKRCGLEQPACARCVKLKKICSGYRDITALQIQDESESVRQKANKHRARTPVSTTSSAKSETVVKFENGIATPRSNEVNTPYRAQSIASDDATESVQDDYGQLISLDDTSWDVLPSSGTLLSMTPKPYADDVATTYFFNNFTASQGHWMYLRDMARNADMDPVLDLAVKACGMAALNNVEGVVMGRDYSRMMYGEALGLLNSALRDSKRSKTDDSLLAVAMLGYYENLTCDSRESIVSWKAHISGASQMLKLRGKSQFQTAIGRTLYRETRAQILIQCIWDDIMPPSFIMDLEDELQKLTRTDDPASPIDRLTRTCYDFATIRAKLRTQQISEQEAMEQMAQVEMKMVQWSIDTMNDHALWRYHDVEVPESPHVWNNLVHSYSSLFSTASTWNTYRSMRIMMTRVQEMLYRRLTVNIRSDDAQIAYFQSVRRQMTDEICYGMPTQLGHASPAFNSPCPLITAYNSVWPLFFAGTCTLERIGTNYFGVNKPSVTSAASAQTAWIIDRMEYISNNIGLRWAEGIAATLKGNFEMHGDIMEAQDKDYIRFYWQQKARRERLANGKEPEQEPGVNAPAWVRKIQQAGRTQKALLEKENQFTDEIGKPAEPVWVGGVKGW